MILGNYRAIFANPGRDMGGITSPRSWQKQSVHRNYYFNEASISGETNKGAFPNGYTPPYIFILPIKAGGLKTYYEIIGSATISANAALGKNCEASISGVGAITPPSLSMLVQLAASILTSSSITASLQATASLSASISASASVSANLSSLAFCVSNIIASASVSGTFKGVANMQAEVTPFTELSPQSLAAAVWNALAADFYEAGTMGEKLNGAGSAGDPWTTTLPGAYADGTAGKIIGEKLLRLSKFLALK